jgi:hypothetical protein
MDILEADPDDEELVVEEELSTEEELVGEEELVTEWWRFERRIGRYGLRPWYCNTRYYTNHSTKP